MTARAPLAVAGAALVAAGAFLGGLYDLSSWGPLALGAFVLAMVALAAGGPLPHGIGGLTCAALAGLAALQYLSSLWAEAADRALLHGHQTLLYVVALAACLVLARRRRQLEAVLWGVAAGAVAVAGFLLMSLLTGDTSVFFRGRLDTPLGYVNGQAAVLAGGMWPLVGVLDRTRNRLVCGAAMAAAGLLVGTLVLTQSRGGLLAVAVGALIVVLCFDGRLRRIAAVLTLVVGVVITWDPLTAVLASAERGVPDSGAIVSAGRAVAALAACSGAVWLLLGGIRPREIRWPAASRRTRRTAAALAALLAVAALAVAAPALERLASDRLESFRSLESDAPTMRLASVRGNRYDYWRVAVLQLRAFPLRGVGAGNYDRTYFIERRTQQDVRQAHSIVFQAMGETGLPGLIAVLVLLGTSVALAARRIVERPTPVDRGMLVGAMGLWTAWALQAAVDWIHLLPSVTLPALAALAALASTPDMAHAGHRSRRPWHLVRPPIFAALVVATASLAVLVVADQRLKTAQDLVAADPDRASDYAWAALRLNGESQDGRYVLAAAQARLGRYLEARRALEQAIADKPHDFVARALLGDLATRRGDTGLALRAYRSALQLNPRSDALQEAVRQATIRHRE